MVPLHTESVELGSLAEWGTAGVALLALLASIYAVAVARRISKNADLVAAHDNLMSQPVQAGRKALRAEFERGANWAKLKRKHGQRYDQINHAVGAYQRLAQYARLGYISKRRALKLWGGALERAWPSIESFVIWRREAEGFPQLWDDLFWLARKAGLDTSS